MSVNSPIIVAIDTADVGRACELVHEVADSIGGYKLGLEFFLANGIEGVQRVTSYAPQSRLFLDLKLHDIPNTVKGAASAVSALNPFFLTVHASGGGEMIRAAANSLPNTLITAVTILTSIDQSELLNVGIAESIDTLAAHMSANAVRNGSRAIVCSPWEITQIRAQVGPEISIITPGVRPNLAGSDDQKRTMTPSQARILGADYLVIGRPITSDSNPGVAAARILSELT